MTRLGYQIPNFTYPDVAPEGIVDVVVRQAEEAEASGFDTVFVMDHFYQLPMLGPPEAEMLECYTLLAALARETERVRLSSLVTGNTYRNPAILAKIITALDHVSGGRAQLGIGAGWFELEHDAFGIEFGTFSDRFEKLEEALGIIVPMLRGEPATLHGEHYRVTEAVNSPGPLSRIPVMIGGAGERKTLRLAARFADDSNLNCGVDEVPRKLDVLAAHCEREGRDRSEITVTSLRTVCVAPTMEEAEQELAAALAIRGMDWSSMSDEEKGGFASMINYGDPDTVGQRLADELALGIDGWVVNAPLNGHVEGRVHLLGETASRVLG
jgi:F420-dependent oxidoreductase-like protein